MVARLKSKSSFTSLGPLRSLSNSKGRLQEFFKATPPSLTAEELYAAQDLQLTRAKCRTAVLGALIGDAACVCLHGATSKELEKLVSNEAFRENPEFYEDDALQQKHSNGTLSPLGDALLPLLQSLVHHGGLDGSHFSQTSFDFFRQYNKQPTEVSRRFVQCYQYDRKFPAGVPVNSFECLTKVSVLVARYAGKPELIVKVKDAVRAHQSFPEALVLSVALAQILERVILGSSILEALSWAQQSPEVESHVQKYLQTVLQSLGVPHAVFVAKQGRSGRLPAEFLNSLHAAATGSSYSDAVRQTLKAGGAGCGRAQVAGALLAAESGEGAIPVEWTEKVTKFSEYSETVGKLIGQRAVFTIMPPP